jgi:hypothetical protein
LEDVLKLIIPKIQAEKISSFGKVLEPQKDIKDKIRRIKNALTSLEVTVPNAMSFYKHIIIFDDSFTT